MIFFSCKIHLNVSLTFFIVVLRSEYMICEVKEIYKTFVNNPLVNIPEEAGWAFWNEKVQEWFFKEIAKHPLMNSLDGNILVTNVSDMKKSVDSYYN